MTIQYAKTVSDEIEKGTKKLIDKAFVWKAVPESALRAQLGRSFQRGITSGKKENLYALLRATELIGMVGTSASMS